MSSNVVGGTSSILNGSFFIFIVFYPPKNLGRYKKYYFLGAFASFIFAFAHCLSAFVSSRTINQNHFCGIAVILHGRFTVLVPLHSTHWKMDIFPVSLRSQCSIHHYCAQLLAALWIDQQVGFYFFFMKPFANFQQ